MNESKDLIITAKDSLDIHSVGPVFGCGFQTFHTTIDDKDVVLKYREYDHYSVTGYIEKYLTLYGVEMDLDKGYDNQEGKLYLLKIEKCANLIYFKGYHIYTTINLVHDIHKNLVLIDHFFSYHNIASMDNLDINIKHNKSGPFSIAVVQLQYNCHNHFVAKSGKYSIDYHYTSSDQRKARAKAKTITIDGNTYDLRQVVERVASLKKVEE